MTMTLIIGGVTIMSILSFFLSKSLSFSSIIKREEEKRQKQLRNDLKVVTLDMLETASLSNQFVFHFQPQLDLKTNKIFGSEVLIRWNHPNKGFLFPDTFLPNINTSEGIILLDHIVIDKTLALYKEWGSTNPLSINVSSEFLCSDSCYTFMSKALDRHAISGDKVILELTETSSIANWDSIKASLKYLKDLGVVVALDDYGKGQTSLQQLHLLPLNYLKIDKSYVWSMLENPKAAFIVESTIGMAHSLGLKVIAEGVETEEQLTYLKNLDCDIVQGYFISKPISYEEVINYGKLETAVSKS